MGLDIYFYKVKEERAEIGYFRKFNFLINYFGDLKNRKSIKITKKEVNELLDSCNIVLRAHKENPNDNTMAIKILPTCGGFFFGTTSYDEYYYEDVKTVKEFIESRLLKEFDDLKNDESIELLISY